MDAKATVLDFDQVTFRVGVLEQFQNQCYDGVLTAVGNLSDALKEAVVQSTSEHKAMRDLVTDSVEKLSNKVSEDKEKIYTKLSRHDREIAGLQSTKGAS